MTCYTQWVILIRVLRRCMTVLIGLEKTLAHVLDFLFFIRNQLTDYLFYFYYSEKHMFEDSTVILLNYSVSCTVQVMAYAIIAYIFLGSSCTVNLCCHNNASHMFGYFTGMFLFGVIAAEHN